MRHRALKILVSTSPLSKSCTRTRGGLSAGVWPYDFGECQSASFQLDPAKCCVTNRRLSGSNHTANVSSLFWDVFSRKSWRRIEGKFGEEVRTNRRRSFCRCFPRHHEIFQLGQKNWGGKSSSCGGGSAFEEKERARRDGARSAQAWNRRSCGGCGKEKEARRAPYTKSKLQLCCDGK